MSMQRMTTVETALVFALRDRKVWVDGRHVRMTIQKPSCIEYLMRVGPNMTILKSRRSLIETDPLAFKERRAEGADYFFYGFVSYIKDKTFMVGKLVSVQTEEILKAAVSYSYHNLESMQDAFRHILEQLKIPFCAAR